MNREIHYDRSSFGIIHILVIYTLYLKTLDNDENE